MELLLGEENKFTLLKTLSVGHSVACSQDFLNDQKLSFPRFEKIKFQVDRMSILEGPKLGRYLACLRSKDPTVGAQHPGHLVLGHSSRSPTPPFPPGGWG